MAIAQPDGSQAAGTSAAPTVARSFTATAGDFLFAAVSAGDALTAWPPGWTVAGRWTTGSVAWIHWGYKIASAAEPSTYTWALGSSTGWVVLVDRYTGFTANASDCLVASFGADAAAAATSLAIPRSLSQQAAALAIYVADSGGSAVARFSAGVTLAGHATTTPAMGWESVASGLAPSRTATYSPSQSNRIVGTAMFQSGMGTAGALVDHATLSGSGSISIPLISAIRVHVTTLPANLGVGKGNPPRYFEVGNVAFGSNGYYGRNHYVEHDQELVQIPFGAVDTVNYSFAPGVVATITEVP